ncbi:MAG: sigma factor [Planctomycetota bacterium]
MTSGGFRTTAWTLVRDAGDAEARAAREELCRRYWPPLYAWLRRGGETPEDAEDHLQAFLLRFIERNDFAVADPERGRFRGYLVAALRNFVRDRVAAEGAEKRGGGRRAFPLESADAESRFREAGGDDPARTLDRAWALAVLETALERLRRERIARGQGPVFELLKSRLEGDGTAPLDEAALAALGLGAGAIKVAVHRLRRRFAELVREEIGRTVERESEIEDELAALLGSLR